MSIRAGFEDDPPAPRRPKIRATFTDTSNGNGNGHSPNPPVPPEPTPERILRFWNFDEDAHRAATPWRFQETPNETLIREAAERDGSWAGL